ncbi:hypothetical protein MMC07_008551, partial [Pseudocyphellaria aurata]|nr:hypothetical protein [Pseudocyphellaria aurata]
LLRWALPTRRGSKAPVIRILAVEEIRMEFENPGIRSSQSSPPIYGHSQCIIRPRTSVEVLLFHISPSLSFSLGIAFKSLTIIDPSSAAALMFTFLSHPEESSAVVGVAARPCVLYLLVFRSPATFDSSAPTLEVWSIRADQDVLGLPSDLERSGNLERST